MPLYQVFHSSPLTNAQRDALAERITLIHTSVFTVPAIFVNVAFLPYAQTPHYLGGKEVTGRTNMVLGNLRGGQARPSQLYEDLCVKIGNAWKEIVGTALAADETGKSSSSSSPLLDACWIVGGLVAVYKKGLLIPGGGADQSWVKENLPKFKQMAADGDEMMKDMIAELETREEFKEAFEQA